MRIRVVRQRDCRVLSVICSVHNPLRRAARNPNVESGKKDRASSQATNQQSSLHDVTFQRPNLGRVSNRHWELLTCFYRAAALAQSCWIWRVSLQSSSRGFSSLPGFAIGPQQSELNRAFFSSHSMRVQRAVLSYCFISSQRKRLAMKPLCSQGYERILKSRGNGWRRT